MNQVFLLKLVKELIESDKPTPEQVRCARVIVNGMIDFLDNPVSGGQIIEPNSELDNEAQLAKQELL